VRSNFVTTFIIVCILIRQLGYEKKLDEDSTGTAANELSGMTLKEACDHIIASLVDILMHFLKSPKRRLKGIRTVEARVPSYRQILVRSRSCSM
jgi:hypothetical protein